MALNADEKKLFEELQARLNEPDEDDNFEVELYDTNAGKGARVPYKSAKNWLHEIFGIGDAPAPKAGEGSGTGGGAPAPGTGDGGAAPATGPQGYFGRKTS
jgi:hypothetical protein